MEAAHLEQGIEHPVLGPNYFAARDSAEQFMSQFEANHFRPLIDKFADDFRDKMWADVESWLLSDTESNLQSTMWRQIDGSVKALLSGEEWALNKYALHGRYDCEKIRAAVARHIPKELQDARVSYLEEEVKQLKESLRFARREY